MYVCSTARLEYAGESLGQRMMSSRTELQREVRAVSSKRSTIRAACTDSQVASTV